MVQRIGAPRFGAGIGPKPRSSDLRGSPAAGLPLEGGQCGDSLAEWNLADGAEEAPQRRTESNPVPDMLQCWFVETFRSFYIEEALLRSPVDGSMTASRCRWFSRRMGGKPTAFGPFLAGFCKITRNLFGLPTLSVLLYTKRPGLRTRVLSHHCLIG